MTNSGLQGGGRGGLGGSLRVIFEVRTALKDGTKEVSCRRRLKLQLQLQRSRFGLAGQGQKFQLRRPDSASTPKTLFNPNPAISDGARNLKFLIKKLLYIPCESPCNTLIYEWFVESLD